jgi:hypothetical protein
MEKIKIKFYHSIGKNNRPSTTAILKIGDNQYIGTATLYVDDNFSKKEGRKFSLQKAMMIPNLSKEERSIVWGTYIKDIIG